MTHDNRDADGDVLPGWVQVLLDQCWYHRDSTDLEPKWAHDALAACDLREWGRARRIVEDNAPRSVPGGIVVMKPASRAGGDQEQP